MRHTKSFVRALKMHQVVPASLRRASEPPKVSVKDFKYDVDERVQQICAEIKASRRFVNTSSEDELDPM